MPKPSTVTELLAIVRHQAQTIEALTAVIRGNVRTTSVQPAVAVPMIPLPAEVDAAIRAKSGMEGELRDYLEQWAWEALASGLPEQLVAEQIAQGVQD